MAGRADPDFLQNTIRTGSPYPWITRKQGELIGLKS
jgi:hypothetical protein